MTTLPNAVDLYVFDEQLRLLVMDVQEVINQSFMGDGPKKQGRDLVCSFVPPQSLVDFSNQLDKEAIRVPSLGYAAIAARR